MTILRDGESRIGSPIGLRADWVAYLCFNDRLYFSVPEAWGLQRVYRRLGVSNDLPLLSVGVEQHAARGAVRGADVRLPDGQRRPIQGHHLRRTLFRSAHLWHDEQPPRRQDAQNHRSVLPFTALVWIS